MSNLEHERRFGVYDKARRAPDSPAAAIADVPIDINASTSQNADAVNDILAVLRRYGLIQE